MTHWRFLVPLPAGRLMVFPAPPASPDGVLRVPLVRDSDGAGFSSGKPE